MIDFLKINVKNFSPSKLEANSLLEFITTVNTRTGELGATIRSRNITTPSKAAFYRGLEFRIYETGTIIISGSLHKYWNNGDHNYNDFGVAEVREVLHDLKIKFGIDPNKCVLKCLEIGVNINPPTQTNSILDNCFLHKTKPFEYRKNSFEGKYKQVEHAQYIIKIYNKALHYVSKGFKVEAEIMRFEIKYTKMEKLNKRGIYTLQDLLDYGLCSFKKELLSEWQNVMYYDNTICLDNLSFKIKKALLHYANPNYWMDLITKKRVENFKYHKNQLKRITNKNSFKIHEEVAKAISEKISLLNSSAT